MPAPVFNPFKHEGGSFEGVNPAALVDYTNTAGAIKADGASFFLEGLGKWFVPAQTYSTTYATGAAPFGDEGANPGLDTKTESFLGLYSAQREGGRLGALVPKGAALARVDGVGAGFGYVLDAKPQEHWMADYQPRGFWEGLVYDALTGPVAIIAGGYAAGLAGTAIAGAGAAAAGAGAGAGAVEFAALGAGAAEGGALLASEAFSANVGFTVADELAAQYLAQGYIPGVVLESPLTLMPPAAPESAAQLAEWGLKETAPGLWEMPALPSSSPFDFPSLPNLPKGAGDALGKIVSDLGKSALGTAVNSFTRTLLTPSYPEVGPYPPPAAHAGGAGLETVIVIALIAVAVGALLKGKG